MHIRCDFNTIKKGFQRFYRENNHYPTVFDIDSCPYLPSSRQIQRVWPGGVKEVRKLLGLEITDFTTGESRSRTSKDVGTRGRAMEVLVQKLLVERFGEVFVHEQKPFGDYSGRFDFVVYAKNIKFAVDVFYAVDKASFTGCLNNKINTYRGNLFPVYLLQINDKLFDHFDISAFISRKKNSLPTHLKVLSLKDFSSVINSMEPYTFKLS